MSGRCHSYALFICWCIVALLLIPGCKCANWAQSTGDRKQTVTVPRMPTSSVSLDRKINNIFNIDAAAAYITVHTLISIAMPIFGSCLL